MKRESRGIKEEEKERKRGGRQTKGKKERKRGERKREWGLAPLFMILYWPWSHLCVYLPIYLVKNPLPVDVGIVGQTMSNTVLFVVFSFPQTRC